MCFYNELRELIRGAPVSKFLLIFIQKMCATLKLTHRLQNVQALSCTQVHPKRNKSKNNPTKPLNLARYSHKNIYCYLLRNALKPSLGFGAHRNRTGSNKVVRETETGGTRKSAEPLKYRPISMAQGGLINFIVFVLTRDVKHIPHILGYEEFIQKGLKALGFSF